MLDSDPRQLARLIRHELTHVALGSLDDDVPTWLGEGIAEWVSVQPLPEDQRLISQAAIDAATAGLDELPADLDYNDEDQAAHYGISWWACEAIVDMYGEPMLWRLLDDLAATSPATRTTSCSRPSRWVRGSWPARRRSGSWRRTDDSRVAPGRV